MNSDDASVMRRINLLVILSEVRWCRLTLGFRS